MSCAPSTPRTSPSWRRSRPGTCGPRGSPARRRGGRDGPLRRRGAGRGAPGAAGPGQAVDRGGPRAHPRRALGLDPPPHDERCPGGGVPLRWSGLGDRGGDRGEGRAGRRASGCRPSRWAPRARRICWPPGRWRSTWAPSTTRSSRPPRTSRRRSTRRSTVIEHFDPALVRSAVPNLLLAREAVQAREGGAHRGGRR